MNTQPYSTLIRYKQWADSSLYEMVAQTLDRFDSQDATILLRVLDHILVVDQVFQHHLQGLQHTFHAPRSDEMPDIRKLAEDARRVDDWYVSYVGTLSARDLDEPLDFLFTSGKPARMTRGEIILHISLHGTYHRGNAGLVLQKNGIAPNNDRMTDFLEQGA